MIDKTNNISLRTLLAKDIREAMRLKDAEGWNQTEKDWNIFLGNTKNINLIATVDNETAGMVTAINYDNAVAWLGMMIVDNNFRGLGISRQLMTTAIETLKQNNCKSIKLDATPQGRPVYLKLGFIEEYTINRMVNLNFDHGPIQKMISDLTEPVAASEISEIIDLDHRIFGVDRSQLIRQLINDYPERSILLKRHGKIEGVILGRAGTRYSQIGPVMATNDEDAKILIASALQGLHNQPVVIDVLEDKAQVVDWLISIGFVTQRPFYRMYLDKNPFPGKPSNQYLICGPEFG